jgi:hypothetical protein
MITFDIGQACSSVRSLLTCKLMSADRLNPSEECVKLVWENLISFPTPVKQCIFPKSCSASMQQEMHPILYNKKKQREKVRLFLVTLGRIL